MKFLSVLPNIARRRVVLPLIAASLSGMLLAGCPGGSGGGGGITGGKNVPAPGDPKYAETVSAFFSGTIALETNDKLNRDINLLKKATELAPGEPAAWANLALAYLPKNQKAEAEQAIQKAKELAPDKPEVLIADGFVQKTFGQFDEALKRFQTVTEKDPNNLQVLGFVAYLANQARLPDSEKLQQEMYDRILKVHPDNIHALIEGIRVSAQAGDATKAKELNARLVEREKTFSADVQRQLQKLKSLLDAGDLRQVRIGTLTLQNLLKSTPGYQASKREVTFDDEVKGEPISYLLTMQNPSPTPAEPDAALTFAAQPIPGASAANVALATVLEPQKRDAKPVVFISDGKTIVQAEKQGAKSLSLPAGAAKQPSALNRSNFALVDFDNDFLTDIIYAGPGGLRIFRQGTNQTFTDVTSSLKLPAAVTNANYTRVEAIDFEADGDLDLMLSPASGPPVLLQNNGDKTFTSVPSPFTAVACPIKAFAWGDIDGDGDAGPAFADKDGKLVLYSNERSGFYRPRPAPEGVGKVAALTVAEVTGDAIVDLVALQDDGAIIALPDKDHGLGWSPTVNLCKSGITNGTSLIAAEMDNNGGIDLLVGDAQKSELYLSDKERKFTATAIPVPASIQSVIDLTDDGLLDVIGVVGSKPVRAVTTSTKKYKWQEFTLYLDPKAGAADRINTFCIGGEAEIRAGLLYQKQTITHPRLHFGLGDNSKVDVSRVIWTTGNAQSEFDMSSGIITEVQRLGGSCPFLYTWDGTKMVFVTDCIWRSPLGLKINAQATAGATQPEDWVKVRGEQLAPKDGFYNISITGELRETHYFDLVNLMVVDHPEDTEIYVDERFVPTAGPILKVFQTAAPQPVIALGANGQDVSEIVKDRDTKYLDDFGRGQYQGVAKDHWVEVALPDNAPRGKPLYLIAFGWLHPTDSSINVAIGQNKSTAPPSGISLETPDASGKWSVAKPGLGFPAGKVKTIVLRIDDAFKPNAPRRLRLRTNLEIFWDQIQWAEEKPNTPHKIQKLTPETANLRYRGFSQVEAKDVSSPELPLSYDEVVSASPRWRDLEGFHTRFGDIKPLLSKVDDRYVIMNAGDEMQITFKEVPPPPVGWKRDYVVIGDGWEKDGNINTTFGKTVMPYPLHSLSDYNTPPGRLEDDPAYKRHPQDWAEYHTRYVTPDNFQNALLPRRLPLAQK